MGRTPSIVVVFVLLAAAGGVAHWLTLPAAVRVADATDRAQVAKGDAVYREHCASCHGVNLEGQANWRERLPDGGLAAPPHDATGHTWHHADRHLFEVTKFGGQPQAPPGFRSNMPAFEGKLTDADIWAVLAFIKSRWPDEIRKRHQAINDRYRNR